MAYSREEEKREELLVFDKGRDKIVVSKIDYKGNESIDIRTYYINQENELTPTQKGVRFSCENLLDVVKVLTKQLETDEKMDLASMLSEDICDEDDTE